MDREIIRVRRPPEVFEFRFVVGWRWLPMAKKKGKDDDEGTAGDAAAGATGAGEEKHDPEPPASDVAPGKLPTRGRIIEFTNDEGTVMPAIVTLVRASAFDEGKGHQVVGMHVCGFDPIMGPRNYHLDDAGGALRESSGEALTWNWPPRA